MQKFKNFLLIGGLCATVAMTGLTGCASWWTKKEGGRSVGTVIDDRQTTKRVESALKTEPIYKFTDVDVKTFDGVVQLSGFVQSQEQKQKAGEIAQRTEGVAKVINNISVQQIPTPTGRAQGQSSAPISK